MFKRLWVDYSNKKAIFTNEWHSKEFVPACGQLQRYIYYIFSGLVTWLACQITGSLNEFFTANCIVVNAPKVARGNALKTLKMSLNAFGIHHDTWETAARDRNSWRASLRKGAVICEATRTARAVKKRQDRKTTAGNPPPETSSILCPHCQRTFRAKIGLISHLRTHGSIPSTPLDEMNGHHHSWWTNNATQQFVLFQMYRCYLSSGVNQAGWEGSCCMGNTWSLNSAQALCYFTNYQLSRQQGASKLIEILLVILHVFDPFSSTDLTLELLNILNWVLSLTSTTKSPKAPLVFLF